MSKKRREKLHIIEDGDVVVFDKELNHTYLGCCKCQLVHHVTLYEVLDGPKGQTLLPLQRPIAIRFFRDEEATNWRRRKR